MAGTPTANEGTHHHTLSASVLSREEKNIPFNQEKVAVPEKNQEGLVRQSDIGEEAQEGTFGNKRTATGSREVLFDRVSS